MEQQKKDVFDYLLSKEGIKSTCGDLPTLFKYYGFNIDGKSVYGQRARSFKLPEKLVRNAQMFGVWSIFMGDPDGFSRHQLIRDLLKYQHFSEFVDYPQLLDKIYRAKFVTKMIAEIKETQEEIDSFWKHK